MGTTIKDVAKKAGVSIATVSRAFNDSDLVLAETKKLVRKVARDLHYSPNASARSLSTRKTETIGLLLPDLYGEFFSEVMRGADLTARRFGYHLLLSSSHNSKTDITAAINAMRGRVDGLIIMSPLLDASTLHANLPSNLPVVLLNCYLHGEPFDALSIENVQGAYLMVQHLISHGHSRIAILKGTEENIDAQERLRGYRNALIEAGIEVDMRLEFPGNFNEESAYSAVKDLLALKPRPTAIFASNDSMAIGALSALRAHGISVPGELALAGFDDIPTARFVTPALSTVEVRINELGEKAIQAVLAAISGKNGHKKKHSMIVPKLVIRESCGCPQLLSSDKV
ncbi:MAG: LacI family transcriptional regulator [Ignavibacteriae bacterium]|nr:LacI family transcriptional regulator [Ignavibacteriota bacterium]